MSVRKSIVISVIAIVVSIGLVVLLMTLASRIFA